MVDYLFIIPASPDLEKGSLRQELQKLCFQQLQKLEASYMVWLLGDADVEHSSFRKVICSGKSKEDKLKEAGDELNEMPRLAKYLVRLDDDDLINPHVFDNMATLNFDIAFDKKHFFYDLATDLTSCQKRAWVPNTAILNYNSALTKVVAIGGAHTIDGMNYLFACDHSQAWHPFFEKMNVVHPEEPIYLRILNPQSITAGGPKQFSKKNYFRYLDGFGTWRAPFPSSLVSVKFNLQSIRKKQFGEPLKFKPKRSIFNRWR